MKEDAVAIKDDQREVIIRAATEMFAQYGYKKATLESIGQSIGKVKSYVYYYFKNKEDLFEAVIDREVEQLRSKFQQILTSDMPASKKLEEYTKRRMSLIFQLANYFSLISNGVLINPSLTDKLRRKYDEKEVEHIKEILTQGVEAGEFRIKDVDLASLGFFTVLKGLEIPLFTSNESQTNINHRIDDLLSIIFNGIRSK
ncbi:TetR/AcrR family transcriptional regulator [Acetobacteroides hydrogenigenes]|uniref:AcrR family transcriptional regulator n=1 Tax=Acetobacteroides hydrogenigenes TaxID=979970 RepID=A0A4R2ENF1_9BACT|nr:TetR/AcrR family transcriptional regulator [Acetobacteroides hydrogenigenes]TCN68976.1 AcrR family transcriptional regulator [Acetobacteroides hydrogenigenes]